MAALIRCGLRKSHNLGQSFIGRNLPISKLPLQVDKRVRCLASVSVSQDKKLLLIDIHKKIDHNVGITTELFNSLKSSIEEHGSVTEHDVALLLHICSFGPFDSSSANRLKYADEIWNKLEQLSVPLTSKLYNMKLKAYCANDRSFTPVEELAAMKSCGVRPDKITYGYLIEGFCRNGDVTDANHVLEAMNDANLSIGTSVFNSFITGHLKAGSSEEAENILKTLRERGLIPTHDTYYRFVHHYAMEGDADSVIKYIKEAEAENVPLDQSLLLKVYQTMLVHGKQNEAHQIVPILLEKDVFRNTSLQALSHLVAEGFPKEAVDLYLNIPKGVTYTKHPSSGSFLLKSMMVNNQTANDMLDVAEKLVEAHPYASPHHQVLLFAYNLGRYDDAIKVIEEMTSRSHEVRFPHILPALCHYRDAGSIEDVYKTVDMILNLGPSEDTIQIMKDFCYPALTKLKQTDDDIIARMKNHEKKWTTFFMIKALQTDGCDAALEYASKPLDSQLVSWLNNSHYLFTKNITQQKEACTKLVCKLLKDEKIDEMLALNLLTYRENDFDTIHHILDTFKQEKITLPMRFLYHPKVAAAPQDIQDKFKVLCVHEKRFYNVGTSILTMMELKDKTKDELEEYVKKYPKHFLGHVALLNKAIATQNLTDIKLCLQNKSTDFEYQKHQLTSIITALTDLGDSKLALQYFQEFQKTYEGQYADFMPLAIAAKEMEAGNFNNVLEMIDAAKNSMLKKLPTKMEYRKHLVASLIKEAKTMEETEAIHGSLVKGKSYLNDDEASYAHFLYVNKALKQDDDQALLTRLTEVRDQYWKFPCMDMVISRFVQKQDIESLKQVMELGVSVVGNNLFHHRLAYSFIVCGMPSKAAAIYQKLNDNLNSRMLERSCKTFIKNDQIQHVEELVEMVKTLPVSRAMMLKQLIEAYVKADKMDKAAGVLEVFDAEFLVPHNSSLEFLAEEYKKKKMEQPEILKAFLSKKEAIVDQSKPQASDSSSDSESDSDSKPSSQPQTKSSDTDSSFVQK